MSHQESVKCSYCGAQMKKWRTPADSTWGTDFQWVCFNDECSYFKEGWDHMMKTQNVKASYRNKVDPEKGTSGPLPCWSYDAHKDQVMEE